MTRARDLWSTGNSFAPVSTPGPTPLQEPTATCLFQVISVAAGWHEHEFLCPDCCHYWCCSLIAPYISALNILLCLHMFQMVFEFLECTPEADTTQGRDQPGQAFWESCSNSKRRCWLVHTFLFSSCTLIDAQLHEIR